MGLLDWLLGRKPTSTSSSVPGVFDLRGDDERRMEQDGKSSLNGEDEQLAWKLVDLVQRYDALYRADRAAADKIQEEIKSIGQHLCSNGGDTRMMRVAYRVAALGAGNRVRIRDLEFHWDGICGWMY